MTEFLYTERQQQYLRFFCRRNMKEVSYSCLPNSIALHIIFCESIKTKLYEFIKQCMLVPHTLHPYASLLPFFK